MSCSARLPVYFLIVPLLLHEDEGSWRQALFVRIYALGTLSAFVRGPAAAQKTRTGQRTLIISCWNCRPTALPQWSYIMRHVFERGWAFVAKAGTVILGLSILLWALSTYPKSRAMSRPRPSRTAPWAASAR
jgi:ferrous iron transport protein B